MLRSRLERETGPSLDRLREAITIANNEIHRLAASGPNGTAWPASSPSSVIDEARAIVGHVGDTRLYKIRHDRIEKVTRDHSPVGEREDAHELSELEAMHHPRRNEVYRDVGSERTSASDPDFIDVQEIPFEPDAALLLCSDGLTDLVESDDDRPDRPAVGGPAAAGGQGAHRRRERRRRQGQHHRRLRRRGAVRAQQGSAAAPVEITRRLSTGRSASSARERWRLRTDVDGAASNRRQAVPLDAARAAHGCDRACR